MVLQMVLQADVIRETLKDLQIHFTLNVLVALKNNNINNIIII